jgi:hypothetical protein
MHATQIIGYTYNAATHCVRCTQRAAHAGGLVTPHVDISGDSERDANGLNIALADRAGNRIAPMFASQDSGADYCDDCGHAIGTAEPVVRVLSVDAWRDGAGWTWNQWHARGFVPRYLVDATPRALLAYLRARNCYALPAPGRAAVEDDGYNVVVVMKGTREPLLALAYGEAP